MAPVIGSLGTRMGRVAQRGRFSTTQPRHDTESIDINLSCTQRFDHSSIKN